MLIIDLIQNQFKSMQRNPLLLQLVLVQLIRFKA